MNKKSPTRSLLAAVPRVVALATAMLMAGCMTSSRQYVFEVQKGATIEDRVENAKAAVTDERFNRLKAQLREMYPALTASHLERFGVRWLERWAVTPSGGKSDRSVTITVVMEEQAGVEAAAVVESAARLLDAEINGPDHRAIEDHPK